MEENVGTFNDWEALVVEEFDSKTIQDHVSISCINDPSDNINVVLDDQSKKSPSSSSSEVEFRGSIAERRAAKFGFDASRIDVAKFKASCPPSLSPVPSPYLTIPPGISPAALLDSPIMLPNCQVQQSPTTGTLQLLHCNHDSLVLNSESPAADRDKGSAIHNSTLVKPPDEPTLMFPLSAEFQLPTNSRSPGESRNIVAAKSCFIDRSTETKISEKMHQKSNNINLQPLFDISIVKNQLPQLREGIKGETGIHELHQDDQKVTYPTASEMTRNAEDGYSWRKYGQKHVKGSEYPRSYYKCNNSNCPVKKKVERSHDGEITEIIYKGAHNHPKPHPRVSLGSSAQSSEMLETSEGSEAGLKVESGTGRRLNNQLIKSNKDFRVSSGRRPDDMERTSSTSVLTEALDPLTAIQGKSAKVFRLTETPEIASTVAYPDGEDEDRATQGSTSQGDEADGDESEPKRRKKEAFSIEAYLPSRSTREPRVIVQIESEIDVLDDGYRWRKYGQKVVKGNPNPRSYYKCTSAGCPVRKHVERASDDIKSVLTTYEGKHNHEVPTTKTSTGLPTASSLAPDIRDPNPSLMPRNPNVSNLEMHVQDLPLHYEMKPAVLGNHDFLRYNLLGDFVTDHMQIGASSIYQMKFPPTTLQSSIPYGTFLMNSNANESRASCQKFPPVFPDFPVSIPMNVARSSPNVALSNTFHSFNHNQAIICNGTAVQSSLGGDQHFEEGDLRFLRPKEEKKEDSLYETCLTNPDNANASSTIFYQAI